MLSAANRSTPSPVSVDVLDSKNVLAISVDFDNCYSYLHVGGSKITDHTQFHEFLLETIQKGQYDEVILLNGSARQTRNMDAYAHTACFWNGSITQSLPRLLTFLQRNTQVTVTLNTWLLEDVVMGFSVPEQFVKHNLFVQSNLKENGFFPIMPRHISRYSYSDSEASKLFNTDKEKTSLFLFQTHLLNKSNPEAAIDFLFVDDLAEDLCAELMKQSSVESLIPQNVKFQFVTYVVDCQPAFVDKPTIFGSGKNCLEDITSEIAQQVERHTDTKKVPSLNTQKIIQCVRTAQISQSIQSISADLSSISISQSPRNLRLFNCNPPSQPISATNISETNHSLEICIDTQDTQVSQVNFIR